MNQLSNSDLKDILGAIGSGMYISNKLYKKLCDAGVILEKDLMDELQLYDVSTDSIYRDLKGHILALEKRDDKPQV